MSKETAEVVRRIPKVLKKLKKHLKERKHGVQQNTELKEDLYELEKINTLLNKSQILDNL